MAARVMHRLAMKFSAVFSRMLTTGGECAMISLAVVVVMIDMAIEMFWSMKPWASTNKDTAGKPFRAVISVGRTIVWRDFIIAVRAIGRCSDINGNLRVCLSGACDQKS